MAKEVKRWMGPRDACDLCGKDISKEPFVDGNTRRGWGLLCLACHKTHGVGLGTGKGQKYDADGVKVVG
jgi:hypothetical protein